MSGLGIGCYATCSAVAGGRCCVDRFGYILFCTHARAEGRGAAWLRHRARERNEWSAANFNTCGTSIHCTNVMTRAKWMCCRLRQQHALAALTALKCDGQRSDEIHYPQDQSRNVVAFAVIVTHDMEHGAADDT